MRTYCRLFAVLTLLAHFAALAQTTISTAVNWPTANIAPNSSFSLTATVTPASASTNGAPLQITLLSAAGTPLASKTVTGGSNGAYQVAFAGQPAGVYEAYAQLLSAQNTVVSTSSTIQFYIQAGGGGRGNAFAGQHALLFQGYTAQGEAAAVGTLTADGAGNITAGMLDLNFPGGPALGLRVTGVYSVGGDGIGQLTLVSAAGTQSFTLAVPINPNTLGPVSHATGTAFNGPLAGRVELALQTPSQFGTLGVSGPNSEGDWLALDLLGQTAGGTAPMFASGTLGVANAQSGVGVFLNQTASVPASTLVTYSGSPLNFGANGRFTFTLTDEHANVQPTVNLVGYEIDSQHIYLMTTDPTSTDELLSGKGVE